jgi:hypothetical protein
LLRNWGLRLSIVVLSLEVLVGLCVGSSETLTARIWVSYRTIFNRRERVFAPSERKTTVESLDHLCAIVKARQGEDKGCREK